MGYLKCRPDGTFEDFWLIGSYLKCRPDGTFEDFWLIGSYLKCRPDGLSKMSSRWDF